MRLPNGYGSVYKLPGKRRRAWAAVKTIGFNENGRQIQKYVGYAETKEEALAILADYNKSPWDVNRSKTTFKEVFELWLEHNSLAPNTVRSYTSKFKNDCKDLYNIPYKDLRTYHFQSVIDNCNKSNGTKNIIRKLFRALDKTALDFDIIDKSYTNSLKTFEEEPKERTVFTNEEIEKLWANKNIPNIDIVLIYLYTGFRREELANIKLKDVDLKEWTIKGGSKTKAGKNRIIPIHSKIKEFIVMRVNIAQGDKLFNVTGKTLYKYFMECMNNLGMNHVPHECRHTLETCLDNKNANQKCIDLIMGHESSGVGTQVYNHKTIEQLRETIELLY